MRKMLLLALFVPLGLQAQVADTMRNAIGLLAEWRGGMAGNTAAKMNTVAVVYKWLSKKEHMIYTASAGISTFHDEPSNNIKYVTGNTATTTGYRTIVNMPVVGIGVEWQRQFYKKVYFFAGLEWKVGYGGGGSDTLVQVETIMPPPSPTGAPNSWVQRTAYRIDGPSVDMFLVAIAPHIGAKLEFKRFTIGTMYMNYIWFTGLQTRSGSSVASIDFDASNIYRRFFVTYKF